MARLSLSLLGPFQVALNGKPITDFESDRVRALLAYLAVEADRPHRREKLAALLWPDWLDRSALTNLRNALSNLRKTIGDRKTTTPVLLVDRETIQFNLASDTLVDVHLFKSFTSSDQPANFLEKGIGLYRSSFLEGFGLKDSAPFEEWSRTIRDQLQRQCLTALEQLTDHFERRGDAEKAREYAWKQIALAPWSEEAHRHLMRLLAASGQRSAALAQYETCRHALEQELGVTPSPETVALYESIRDGKFAEREATPQSPVSLASSPRPATLPVWLTPFVAREEIVAEILARVQDPTCRLLTLVGPGGSGKTRLAVEAAAKLAPAFPQGVCFVSLASLQSAENIVPAIAHALALSFREQEEPQPQLLHYLRKRTMLLVLDNFEHLINDPESERDGGVEIITKLLETAPGIKVLVTSRVSLNAPGEHLLPVPSMRYPEQTPANLSDALEYGAVQLFIQDARRVRPGFEPSDEDLLQVIQICRLVQGMPLGILLAAAWMRMLSPAEIATQLAAHKLDFLEVEWHSLPERQRSMRVVFDYSWRLLSERERQILMALAVFRGGFTYAAAQSVAMTQDAAATLRDLMGLVNSSMLQRTATGRYEMHELLRQYAEEKLRQSAGGEQGAHDRHTAYFTAALRQWAMDLEGAHQQDALAELDVENNNVRAAWSWAVKHGQVNRLADGMKGLGAFCDWRARYKEGEKAFRSMAEKLAAQGSAQPAEQLKVWASALAWQARFNQRLGSIEKARAGAHQSLALLDEPTLGAQDVRWERALALEIIGEIEVQFGNCHDGKAPLSTGLALYRELDDRRSVANCLRSLGRLFERIGNYVQAVELHRKSVDICRALGAQRDMVDALLDLMIDLHCLGQDAEADRLLHESFEIAQQLGDQATLTAVRYRMATVLMETEPEESLALLEECVTVYAELGDRHRWALALMRVGDARMHLGEYAQAHAPLQESLAWYRQVDNWWGIGAALRISGELALIEDRYPEAGQLLQESAAAFRRNGARSDVGWALAALGMAAALSGNLDQAQQFLADAMHIALRFRHQFMPKPVLLGQAILAAKEGHVEHALEFWVLLSRMSPFTPRVYQDFYRKHLAPAIATLPPEQIAATHARKQGNDVWATLEELLAGLRD
ncbi:MAG: tetratricopeptide repeat protein [Chloroflexi bacterium]|nr:tetratricopeptide repeat protein [Chloroflexota bacterium]